MRVMLATKGSGVLWREDKNTYLSGLTIGRVLPDPPDRLASRRCPATELTIRL